MGLFSTKRIIYVSSVLYNLSGDPATRPQFLKSTVVGNMLKKKSHKTYLGESITQAHMRGPGMMQRSFFRWAKNHYPQGMPTADTASAFHVTTENLAAVITVPAGKTLRIDGSSVETADYVNWAEQWMLENYPALYGTAWTAEYNELTNLVTVIFEDTTTASFTPADFDTSKTYVYILYALIAADLSETVHMHIYKIGSGNAELDALAAETGGDTEYFPFIPLRLNNKSIAHADFASIYPTVTKAYKRATRGGKISTLLTQIDDNPDVGKIDYAYMVFGVPFNTTEKASKAYIYKFLRGLIPYQNFSNAAYDGWKSSKTFNPPTTSVKLKSAEPLTKSFDVRLTWVNIRETFHTGLGKPDAKVGEYWTALDAPDEFSFSVFSNRIENASMYHQITANTYSRLWLNGLVHQNYVYGGKAVRTDVKDAIEDTEESDFYLPMHYPTLQSMSLIDSTQASIGNALIVFNCYKVVKQRWYQRGIFRIILVIIFVVIAFVINPMALSLAGGLLGANAAVGATLGFAAGSAAAVIAGAVANALIAMIVTQVLTQVAVDVFGEEVGAVIGALVSFVAITVGTNYMMTGSTAVNWGSMLQMDNLMQITDVMSQGYSAWASGKIAGVNQDMVKAQEDYDRQAKEIKELSDEILGTGASLINPVMFTQIADSSTQRLEPSEFYLKRTLLTGSDFVELSQMMIESFAELNLDTTPSYRGFA